MLLRGLNQFPDDTLEPKLYNALVAIHLALFNLDEALELATGIQAYPAADWSSLGATGALTFGNSQRMYVVASEAIAAGEMVNLWDDAGTLSVRLAQANATTTMAHGVANNTAAIGDLVEVYFLRAVVDTISGMVLAQQYWLSPSVAGAIQNTMPVGAGEYIQAVGVAVGATTLLMDISLNWIPA